MAEKGKKGGNDDTKNCHYKSKARNISRLGGRAAKRRSGLAKPEKPAELEKFIWLKLQEYKPAELVKLGQGAEEFSRIR